MGEFWGYFSREEGASYEAENTLNNQKVKQSLYRP
jgi:hypothetical protein